MKRMLMLIALAVGLIAPTVLGVDFHNAGLGVESPAYVAPGSWVLAQKIEFATAGDDLQITQLTIKNESNPNPLLHGDYIEEILIRRDREDGPVLGQQTRATELRKLTTDGVPVTTSRTTAIRRFDREKTHALYVWVKLKSDTPLQSRLVLGATKVNEADVKYENPGPATEATVFIVGPDPDVYAGSPMIESIDVYRGQKFLAQRFTIDSEEVAGPLILQRVLVENIAGNHGLTGAYVSQIQVRRASDGALLGQQSTAAELGKLGTTGVPIDTGSFTVPAFDQVVLEIWVQLKDNAPIGHKLQPQVVARCNGADLPVGAPPPPPAPEYDPPIFTVAEPGGFEHSEDLPLDPDHVFSGQRFLAQRIRVEDQDLNPHDVTITSLLVQNVGDTDARLAESQIAKIEIIRARDGAMIGSTEDPAGLNVGGVRIPATQNNTVRDDTSEIVELWVTLREGVPYERTLQLRTAIWHTEGGRTYATDPIPAEGATTFTTGPIVPQGFENDGETLELEGRTVFQGSRFLAQRIKLVDDDQDSYDVYIASLMIRNVATQSPLADTNVVRIEVRRAADNALLGEIPSSDVPDATGLRTEGVRVSTPNNNRVPDDTSVEIEIWITLREETPAGRKIKLESVVWHTEGAKTFETDALEGPAEFTTDRADPPQNVDFTWTPEEPLVGEQVVFTPDEAIHDPEGDIEEATFHWDFGDGTELSTEGPEDVEHTYDEEGTYEVTLTVTGALGVSASRSKDIEIRLLQLAVDFTWDPEDPIAGAAVTFTAEVENAPVEPLTYAWNFGDGNTSTQAEPSHTYLQAGTYTVTLEVTDAEGAVGTASQSVTVVQVQAPTLGQVAVDPRVPEVGEQVTFEVPTTAPQGDPALEWEWRFGDGTTTKTGQNTTTHTYERSSTFKVEVRARNEAGGWSGWRSREFYVRERGAEPIGTRLTRNPVSTQAVIQVFRPEDATDVQIHIYDLIGRLVHTENVGGDEVRWDLTDDRGRTLPSGVYFYVITATQDDTVIRSDTGRILVVR